MDLSVVVPTLNGRDQLGHCLDALAEHVPDAEVVVVNGPSADGTTGMVRDRGDVACLVEISDRNINVARNAGIQAATGDVVGFVNYDLAVEAEWATAVSDSLTDGADVVTGPTHRTLRAGVTTESEETSTLAGRMVRFFNGGNVAFDREALTDVDGFDEYLETGAARDCAHRLAGLGYDVDWNGEMCVRGEYETDGGRTEREWGEKYRSIAYRLTKNYGVRPVVATRTAGAALRDAFREAKAVVRGDATPSTWLGNGREVVRGVVQGVRGGIGARRSDRSPRRNPGGVSSRHDRAVQRYDL